MDQMLGTMYHVFLSLLKVLWLFFKVHPLIYNSYEPKQYFIYLKKKTL